MHIFNPSTQEIEEGKCKDSMVYIVNSRAAKDYIETLTQKNKVRVGGRDLCTTIPGFFKLTTSF